MTLESPKVEISGRQNWRAVCVSKPRDSSSGPSESPLLGVICTRRFYGEQP